MNPQPVFAWEFIDLSRPHQTITSLWAAPAGDTEDHDHVRLRRDRPTEAPPGMGHPSMQASIIWNASPA